MEIQVIFVNALKGSIIEKYLKQGVTDIDELRKHIDEELPQLVCDHVNSMLKAGVDAAEGLAEVVRLLGKVVPEDQNRMIEWAVKSQDAVYTNAGAAFRIAKEHLARFCYTNGIIVLKERSPELHQHHFISAKNEVVENGYFCPECGALSLDGINPISV